MAYLNSITKIIKQIQDSDEKTRDRYNYHRGLSLHMIKKLMGAYQSQWVYINNALKSGVDKGKLIKTGGKYRVVVTKKKSRKRRDVKRKTSRKRRSAKRKASRKRRSAKRKTSRKRRSAKQKLSRCIEECMKDSKKRKTSRKRRSVKQKGKKKLKFRNGKKAFIDLYFKQNSGPDISGVHIKKLIDQYKTGKSFSGNQILSSTYRGVEIIKPDPEDLCKHPEIFIDFIYRLQKEMYDSLLESTLDAIKMEEVYKKLFELYEKCKRKNKFRMSKKKSRKRKSSRKRRSPKRKGNKKLKFRMITPGERSKIVDKGLTCPICLMDFEDVDNKDIVGCMGASKMGWSCCSKQTGCKNSYFHKKCIETWIKRQEAQHIPPSCPICRAKQAPPPPPSGGMWRPTPAAAAALLAGATALGGGLMYGNRSVSKLEPCYNPEIDSLGEGLPTCDGCNVVQSTSDGDLTWHYPRGPPGGVCPSYFDDSWANYWANWHARLGAEEWRELEGIQAKVSPDTL